MGVNPSKIEPTNQNADHDELVFNVVDDFLQERVKAVINTGKEKKAGKYLVAPGSENKSDIISTLISPRKNNDNSIISANYNFNIISPRAEKIVNAISSLISPRKNNDKVLTNNIIEKISPRPSSNQPESSRKDFKPAFQLSLTIQTTVLANQSVRALAIRHQSRLQNSYIPQEVLSSFIINKKAVLQKQSSLASSQQSVIQFDVTNEVKVSPRPNENSKRRFNLKLNLKDEEDWIQVSDNEEEGVIDSPKNRQTLSLHASIAKQSIVFTDSGTIFVDGFVPGIRTDGIQGSVKDMKLPMRERLPVLCKLGSGASSVVYKALDLTDIRLVALKMVSVFDRGKRRQIVRELSALFSLLRKKQKEIKARAAAAATAAASGSATSTPTLPYQAASASTSPGGAAGAGGLLRHPSSVPTTPTKLRIDVGNIITVRSEDFSASGFDSSSSGGSYSQPWAHIVDFYDAFSNLEDGGVALMVEYMDGGSLQDIVEMGGCCDETTLACIAQQALQGLDFIHGCNQLHRDLKPANMLINNMGQVKVSDFGILRQMDSVLQEGKEIGSMLGDEEEEGGDSEGEGEGIPRARTFVGTVTYMAPERIDGRDYSYPSDVWSLGLSLLTLALGRMPLNTNGGFWSILHSVRDLAPPVVPADGDWSDEFRDFISQCLKHDPLSRATCSSLLQHSFLRKAAAIDTESGASKEAGMRELKSIVLAVYQHLCKLEEAQDVTNVLLGACNGLSLPDVLRLLLLGEDHRHPAEIVAERQDAEEPASCLAHNRLSILAKQLHLSVDQVVAAVRIYCDDLEKEVDSSINPFGSTPKHTHNSTDQQYKNNREITRRFNANLF